MTPLKKKRKPNPFVRFLGLGIQMGSTIYVGNFFGGWLDVKFDNSEGWYSKGLTLFAVLASTYLIIKEVSKLSK